MKLTKGDEVKVVAGKDKGKTGKLEKVLPKANMVLIANVNEYKKHIKARMQGQASEIVTITKPLPVANVALICPNCKKQTRVGYEVKGDDKIRICRKCKKAL